MVRKSFETYHEENPQIYRKLVELAREVVNAGLKRISIGMLYERVRWYTNVEAADDIFKLNDHYRAFYARKLMTDYPEFVGLFEVRKSKADRNGTL